MLIRTKTDFFASGKAMRNAEIGETQSGRKFVRVSIGCGKVGEEKRYANVTCWDELANYAEGVAEGDRVCAGGLWSTTIKNDKEYTNFTADFIQYVPSIVAQAPQTFTPVVEAGNDELPF